MTSEVSAVAKPSINTIIFDLDGTLYEDQRVYDRFAEEIGRSLSPDRREVFLAEWQLARAGRCAAQVGLVYDVRSDRLYATDGRRLTHLVGWDGYVTATEEEPDATGDQGGERAGRFLMGDCWSLLAALAGHHGVTEAARQEAFAATRAYMSTPECSLVPETCLLPTLRALQAEGKTLVAMTNAPEATARDVLERLGLAACFTSVVPMANKPLGLTGYLSGVDDPEHALSVGDHYVNDIEPALVAGGQALYIDRHDTGLGAEYQTCHRVASIVEACRWLTTYGEPL